MVPETELQRQAIVQLAVLGRADPIHVASFRGREEVSALYRMDVQIAPEDGQDDLGATLLGQRVALLFHHDGEIVRTLHGIVLQVESQGTFLRERSGFVLRVVPSMARLERRRTRRIFQHVTSLEIAAQLLTEHGVPFRTAARTVPQVREYAVQYDETDLAFLARLFAEDGLFYFFEHPLGLAGEGSETVVIAGSAGEIPPIHGDPTLRFERLAGEGALTSSEHHIGLFTAKNRLKSARTRTRAYDFRRPDTDLRDDAATPGSLPTDPSLLYDHDGSFEDDRGLRSAQVRLEQERTGARTAEGKSACRRLVPGHSFTLEGHELRALDQPWTVTRIEHEGYSPELVPQGKAMYENRFRAVPAETPVRPRFVPRRPRQVAETAVVVGPRGQDIHTDEHGRVQVQFHWDLEGQRDEKSSCYLRVSQIWADAGWGAQFIPRIGAEVVVTFLGGDLDRPLVTGCVYNATHPHPFQVPENKTRSGIRTRSTPFGRGGNEISFDDTLGNEDFYVHAEHDYREVVGHDRTSRVHRHSTSEVTGQSTSFVGESASSRIGLDSTTEVGRDERRIVGGRASATVSGDSSLEIKGSSSVSVQDKASLEVRKNYSVVVGTGQEAAQSDQVVHGSHSVSASDRIVVRAGKTLRLECGESVIEMTPDKIVVRSKTVEVVPTETLECGTKDGPTMTIGKDTEILSSKLRIFTDGGALEIDQDFKAKGGSIKLGYSPDKPSHEKDEKEPETKPFSCTLSNYFLKPYANKTYHATTEGLRFEGKTDGEGKVALTIPKAAKQVVVRIWLDKYPEGRQRVFTVSLTEELPKPGIVGAKQRLKNLGYFAGPIDALPSDGFKLALAEFQHDHHETHGLEPTGALDEGTEGALEEVHGH